MTAFADGKIIASKSALAIMTSHTALRPRACVMIQRRRLRNLSSLRHCGPDLVAFVAIFFLMLGMTEADAESLREFRSAPIATQLMAGAA